MRSRFRSLWLHLLARGKRIKENALVHRAVRATGLLSLALGVAALILGILSRPDTGLMFALPYLFFLAALVFSVTGVVILLITKPD
jgi:hypothetical protein